MERRTIQEHSQLKLGTIWTAEDHERLCHHIEEINRTAAAMALAAQRVYNSGPESRNRTNGSVDRKETA